MLRFKSVRDADLGIYTCQAENPYGRAEAAIEMSGNLFRLFFLSCRVASNYPTQPVIIFSCFSCRPSLFDFCGNVVELHRCLETNLFDKVT